MTYVFAAVFVVGAGCFSDLGPEGSSGSATGGSSTGGGEEGSTGSADGSSSGTGGAITRADSGEGTVGTDGSGSTDGADATTGTTAAESSTASGSCLPEDEAVHIAVLQYHPQILDPGEGHIIPPVIVDEGGGGYLIHVCDLNVECACEDAYGWIVTVTCAGVVIEEQSLGLCPFG